MDSISRREFIEAALAACACVVCPMVAEAQAPPAPGASAAAPAAGGHAGPGGPGRMGQPGGPGGWAPPPTPSAPVNIGAATKYTTGGIFDEYAKTGGFIVVSEKGKIYAVTSICPHKRGGLVKDPTAAGTIKCTKHDGKFNTAGIPISGPPKTSLARLGISKNAAGQLVVDPSKQFQQADWEKPEASVKAV